jgi:hypothetical protein
MSTKTKWRLSAKKWSKFVICQAKIAAGPTTGAWAELAAAGHQSLICPTKTHKLLNMPDLTQPWAAASASALLPEGLNCFLIEAVAKFKMNGKNVFQQLERLDRQDKPVKTP